VFKFINCLLPPFPPLLSPLFSFSSFTETYLLQGVAYADEKGVVGEVRYENILEKDSLLMQ
jgi:hypothetical protein